MATLWSDHFTISCLVLGLCAGILSATFGVGAGIIVVPALTLVAALPQKDAQGIALVVMIPMAMMGAIRYHLNPEITIDFKIVLLVSLAALVGANIGATIAGAVSNRTLQGAFGAFVIVVGIRVLWKAISSS